MKSFNPRAMIFLSSLFMIPTQSSSQNIFKTKLKVFVNIPSSQYEPKFIDTKRDIRQSNTVETFNPGGVLISYQKSEKPDWIRGKKMNNSEPYFPRKFRRTEYLYADIKPDDGRLLLYFWPFKINKHADAWETVQTLSANEFLKSNTFFIDVPERINLGFKLTSYQLGTMTLPLKVFIGGPDSVSKVFASANIGLYFGKRFGRRRYVKYPHEKEFTVYEKSHSWSVILGINKLDLDDKNTKDDGKKFQGSIAAISTGFSYGIHVKNFTLFSAVGFDTPLGKRGKLWSLKGRPWFGFGAGFDLFK